MILPSPILYLHEELKEAIEPPFNTHPEFIIGKLWAKAYAGPYFDNRIKDLWGWKTDWLKGARLFFMTTAYMGGIPEDEFVLTTSKNLPLGKRECIARWMLGDLPNWSAAELSDGEKTENLFSRVMAVRTLLEAFPDRILKVADGVRQGLIRDRYQRAMAGTMTVDDWPEKWQEEGK